MCLGFLLGGAAGSASAQGIATIEINQAIGVAEARATVKMDPGSNSSVVRSIESRAGGLQVGGGVRVLF